MRHYIAGAWALLAAASAMAAGSTPACGDGLKIEGSLLTGKTFKNSSTLPGVAARDAFERALAYTRSNGFTVLSASAEQGEISAAQSAQLAKGSKVPLNIVVRDAPQGAQMSLSYRTGVGQLSPEAAVAAHFCQTFAVAADASAPRASAPSAPSVPAPVPAPAQPSQALATAPAPAPAPVLASSGGAPTSSGTKPVSTSFVHDGFPCFQDVCVGQDITKVKGIQWLDGNPAIPPIRTRPPGPDVYSRVGNLVKADTDTLKVLAEADVQQAYGPRAIAALARVEASCGILTTPGATTLRAYFKSPAGHATTVEFGAYSPQGEPLNQYFRISSIIRHFATAVTEEQRQGLRQELEKQFEPVIKHKYSGPYDTSDAYPFVTFVGPPMWRVILNDRLDVWRDIRNRLLQHPKCGGAVKIDVN